MNKEEKEFIRKEKFRDKYELILDKDGMGEYLEADFVEWYKKKVKLKKLFFKFCFILVISKFKFNIKLLPFFYIFNDLFINSLCLNYYISTLKSVFV